MAKGTRIRWQKAAKLAAGVVACIALVAGLPALLKRPKPPPLPADVGLSHVVSGSPAARVHDGQAAARPRSPRPEHRREHQPKRHPHHKPTAVERHAPPESDEAGDSSASEPTPVAAAPPVESQPVPPPPAPAPAPAYPPPPPAPAPPPVTTSSSSQPTQSQPADDGGSDTRSSPSEFGFEH